MVLVGTPTIYGEHEIVNVKYMKKKRKKVNKEYCKKSFKRAFHEFFFGINPKDYDTRSMNKKEKRKFIEKYKRKYLKKPLLTKNQNQSDKWERESFTSRRLWDLQNEHKSYSVDKRHYKNNRNLVLRGRIISHRNTYF